MERIDCSGKTSREINEEIRRLISAGVSKIEILSPLARHNLAVGLLEPVELFFEGSVGYYCGGMIDGPQISINGSAGWGLGECMMNGTFVVKGNVGNSVAASIRGGTVVVHGDAGARAGIAMKGGLLIIEGDCGTMAGFMMQKGILIICGNSADALSDSMYEGIVYLGGEARSYGNDTQVREPDDRDWSYLQTTLNQYGISSNRSFKKIVAGRRLWNFEKQEFDIWKEVL
jgi:glutamate synthase domain-containing protein 3